MEDWIQFDDKSSDRSSGVGSRILDAARGQKDVQRVIR